METLVVKIKSGQAAQVLAEFLETIEYVEAVEQRPGESSDIKTKPLPFARGLYSAGEKPSDYAGIWKGRKKIDAQQLRKRAWQRAK